MPPSPSHHVYAPDGWPGARLPSGAPIENLPITSPYCVDDACRSFREGFADDERRTPLLRLLEYGKWAVWFYSFWILLFTAVYVYHKSHDYLRTESSAGRPSLKDKAVALVRFWTYRRPDNRITRKINLRKVSYGTIALLALSTAFFGTLPWPQKRYLRARFRFGSPPLSVRCALIISALTPLCVALAGKVNVITWMTGIGYEKLNVYHRYVAYLIFFFSTIHTVPHLIAPVQDGGWSMLNKLYANERRELSGTPLYFATFGLAFFSIPWIRNRFYEAFKYVHVFLAISYLALFWWHIWGEYMSPYYMYATIASLVISNLVRLLHRHRNLRSFSNFTGFPSTIELMRGNMTRITVHVPTSVKWRPGQHAFLRIPRISWLGNHPFSIANIPSASDEETMQDMVFLIRRKDGWTRKLYENQPELELSSETVSEASLLRPVIKTVMIDKPTTVNALNETVVETDEPNPAGAEKGVEHIENINNHVDAITVVEEEVLSPMSPFAQPSFPPVAAPRLRTQPSTSSFPPRDEITEAKLRAIAEKPVGIPSSHPSSSRLSGSTQRSSQLPIHKTGASTERRSSVCSLPPRDHITEAKLAVIASKPGVRPSLRTIIDGPYGTHHRPLYKIYDTVLCVAGGSGITVALPHILDLSQRISQQRKDVLLVTRRMHLVWIVREAQWCSWIEKDLSTALRRIRALPASRGVGFTVDVYVTRSAALAEEACPSEDQLSPISPISPAMDDKAFEDVQLDVEKGTITLPSRPRPAMRRLNGGRGLFESEMEFGIGGDGEQRNWGVSMAMHYCRPVVRDVVEGYCGGERMVVLGCGPPSLSAELANAAAALQRRVWSGEMRELALQLEICGW